MTPAGMRVLHAGADWDRAAWQGAVARRAAALAGQGLRASQVVLAPDLPALDLALMQQALVGLGAAVLPHRAGLEPSGIQALAALTGAEWQWQPGLARLLPLAEPPAARPPPAGAPLALLVRTSGSTGAPRVAMLTVAALRAAAAAANERLDFGPGDLWLGCLRLSHIGGLSILWRCARAGASLLLHVGFDAAAVRRDLDRHPVTHLSLVPPMLARLLDVELRPPPRLRVLLVGGQALSMALARRALDAGWPLHLTYGMTETASQAATTGCLLGRTLAVERVGQPLPGLECGAPACGQPPARLRLRGPMLMAGYANPARAPGQGLRDGWFETADLACLEPDGQLRILGRADDLLVIGGTKVARSRIEAVLRELPGIDELVIADQADQVWGRRLTAVYSGPLAPEAAARAAERVLAPTERPRAWRRLERLPLLDAGKYDRVAIASRLDA